MLRVSLIYRCLGWRSAWVEVADAATGRGWRYLSYGSSQGCAQLTHNIGILAHIDAGKTTTTERMLFYAGITSRVGNVNSGNTVMDYLPPERERGITISSAAISLSWAGHTLNLVDTPGHADFTFEVERTLCVLDGAVALLDASSGVEAQTIAVCRQANHYHIPYIAFVNKMDSPRANLHDSVQSMKECLGVQPLLTQLPMGKGRGFRGVVDLVHNVAFLWQEGKEGTSFSHVALKDLPLDIQESSHHHREQLLEQVAMVDDTFAAILLDNERGNEAIDPNDLTSGIRRVCISRAAVPVLCGSALRGVAIQPLMDAVTAYLPAASEKARRVPAEAQRLCAYAFKQVYDVHRGLLVYLRVYAGTLKAHSTIYNASSHTRERVARVLQAQADQLQEVGEACEGSIAVAMGLKRTVTGDTLVQSEAIARSLGKENMASLLTPPTIPPPVFFCTVEPSSAASQRRLDHALQFLSLEDPSLRVRTDQDSGQTVLSGMGELHLEIVEERLCRVYGVECELGELQVAYREGLAEEAESTVALEHTLGSSRHPVVTTVKLSPLEAGGGIEVTFDPLVEVTAEEKLALGNAVEGSLTRGPLLGFPVQGVAVYVQELSRSEGTPLPVLCSSLAHTVLEAAGDADVRLLEPLTVLKVTAPEQHVGAVLSDLTSLRRAEVEEVSEDGQGDTVVTARVPLATLLGYASRLRSLTSGTGSFTMVYSGYCPIDQHQLNIIAERLRGY